MTQWPSTETYENKNRQKKPKPKPKHGGSKFGNWNFHNFLKMDQKANGYKLA